MAIVTQRNVDDALIDQVPNHYLRRLSSERRPRRCVYLDTEAERRPGPEGELQTFALAVAAYERRRADSGHKPSTTWRTFTEGPAELWAWIDGLVPIRETVWVFAHNLQYDLLLSGGYPHLVALGWEMTNLDAPGRLRSMRWRRVDRWHCDDGAGCGRDTWATKAWRNRGDGAPEHRGGTPPTRHYHDTTRRLHLVDTWGLFRLPLEQVGELVGRPKMPMPKAGRRRSEWERYCRRDVEILRDAVHGYLDLIDAEQLGGFQTTLPAAAWAAYRHRFLTDPPLVHRYPEVLELERDAYFGGRSEVLQHGEQTGDLFEDHDIRMCYPYVAATTELPYKYSGAVDDLTPEGYQRARSMGAVLGKCTVTTDRPLVPCRTDAGVCWPVGTFTVALWSPEIDLLIAEGAKVEFLELHLYRTAAVLQPFAQWCIDQLDGDDATTDPLRRHLIKGMSRMLIGKLGQRSRKLVPSDETAPEPWGEWLRTDTTTGETERMVAIDGQSFTIDTSGETDNALPSMAGYITSVARVWLVGLIRSAGRANTIYCDTDGLIVTQAGALRLDAAAARGELPPIELKGAYRRVWAHNVQDLELDAAHVIKGVRGDAERVSGDTFRVLHFTSWSEAVTAGTLDSVTVTTRALQLQRIYKRGWLLDDGQVWPLVVQLDVAGNRVLPWAETPWRDAGRTLADPRQAETLGRSPPASRDPPDRVSATA